MSEGKTIETTERKPHGSFKKPHDPHCLLKMTPRGGNTNSIKSFLFDYT